MPLILLAGRDRRATSLPLAGRDQHLLRGYKALDLEIAGQPLIVRLLECVEACGAFGPIFVAGPAEQYAFLGDRVHLIDTDGDFGENIRAALEGAARAGADAQVAVMTSDILPDPAELDAALDDLRRHQPCDFWAVECRARDAARLGASSWKPRYLIRPEGEDEAVPFLPGHFFVADPGIIRLEFVYTLFELAYRTRNRPTAYRRAVVVRGILATLLGKDLKRIFTLRLPRITWEMLWNGLVIVRKMITTGVPQKEMEERLRLIWIRWSHRRRHPERRGRVMVHDGLSFGLDIDTEEEARAIKRLNAASFETPVG